MKYPERINPTSTEKFHLLSGNVVAIQKSFLSFERWHGEPVNDTYNNKPVVNYNSKPAFAELAILRIFESDGWQGVWVDTYRGKFRTEYFPKNEVYLPNEQKIVLQSIYAANGSRKGCWDVFCWKESKHIFTESKWQGHDNIRDTQRHWLEAAIKCGMPMDSFLVVEWNLI